VLTSRRHSRGFNIIEVMVTVTVLALLLGVGVPSVAEWIRNTQVRSLSEALQNGLQKARSEALKRNRPVSFSLVTPAVGVPDATCALSSASGSWVVSLDSPAGKCDLAPNPTAATPTAADPVIVEKFASTSGGITVAAVATDGTTAATTVTFNGYGLPVAGGTPIGRIDLSHTLSGARALRIQVSASGGVRLCDPAVTAPDPRACL
jgi:type IV fimbrial biogenesis protein FimT